MKNIFYILSFLLILLLGLLLLPLFMMAAPAHSADAPQCVIMSKDALIDATKKYVKSEYVIPAKLRDSYFEQLNKIRKQNGRFEIVTDEMMIFKLNNEAYSIEIFYHGCVLPFVPRILPKGALEVFFQLTGGDEIFTFINSEET